MREDVARAIRSLRANNIECDYLESADMLLPLLDKLIKKDARVAFSGSVTLEQMGVAGFMKESGRSVIAHIHTSEMETVRDSECDVFICGCNAITENGEMYNVDGSGNRVAPLMWGAHKVIAVAGVNKIVSDLDAAIYRVKTVTAPALARRKGRPLYCAYKGRCLAIAEGKTGMTSGCKSPNRICNFFCVTAREQRIQKGRIRLVLINETLGY